MARFTNGWCQFPRESLPISRRDNLLRALFATLCCWAKPPTADDPKILIGQVLTSDEELAAEHGVVRKTIARKLSILVKHNFIKLERDGKRGRIISVISLCPHLVTKDVPNVSRLCPENDPHSEELRNKKEEGEGKGKSALRAEGIPPPFSNSKESLGKLIPIRSRETAITAIPNGSNPLMVSWYGRVKERAPNRRLGFLDICGQIQQLKESGFEEEKLSQILGQLEVTDKKYGAKFISPSDAFIKYFEKDLIEHAYSDFLGTEKGKEALKKKVIPSDKPNIREQIAAQQNRKIQEEIAKMKMERMEG